MWEAGTRCRGEWLGGWVLGDAGWLCGRVWQWSLRVEFFDVNGETVKVMVVNGKQSYENLR